jgi:hypothetical protein
VNEEPSGSSFRVQAVVGGVSLSVTGRLST